MVKYRCARCGKLLFKFEGDIERVKIKCPKCKGMNSMTTVEADPPSVLAHTVIYYAKHQ